MVRCKSHAKWVATENTPDAQGIAGAMSLCSDCRSVMIKQLGADFATITALPDNVRGHRHATRAAKRQPAVCPRGPTS